MPVGKTQDAGWEIGVSRTLPHPIDEVWALLTSRAGLDLWLGAGATLGQTKGDAYETAEGTAGEVRSWRPLDRIRLTWQPPDWDHESTVQVVVAARDDRTIVTFHQERLADAAERERQRTHWQNVMEQIVDALER
jgi:uncharacterized protein YndB with AHSA1/START domain